MRLVRRLSVLGCIAVLTVVAAASVRADAGGANDPDDSAGRLDIRRVSHVNDDDSVTYRLETYEPFGVDDIYLIDWAFDFNGDGMPADACIRLQRLGTTDTLRGAFFGECGPETWATSDARIVDGNALEISFPLIDLVEGGGLQPGSTYAYRVTASDTNRIEDTAPEDQLVEHSDVPAPTARPGSADTQLGFPGERAEPGDPAPAGRAQQTGAEGAAVGAEPSGDGDAKADGPLAAIPVIGNLCSGPMCFAIGVGAPAIVVVVLALILMAIRARRRLRSSGPDDHATAAHEYEAAPDQAARSSPGNV
jgi:hypothetical protein